MKFNEMVYEVVRKVPKGKITTYGDIAKAIHNPGSFRAVANALHGNPNPDITPCHRVVNSKGRVAPTFAFGGENVQRKMLEEEGITFISELNTDLNAFKIDLESIILDIK